MLFPSQIFLFLFLPLVLILYYVLRPLGRRVQNSILLVASLFFYGWGEPYFLAVMVLSICINYIMGILLEAFPTKKRAVLAATLIFNIGLLYIFKYLNFTVENINNIFNANIYMRYIALPIGISFFTFQSMSYVFDVYRGKKKAQRSIFKLALYVSFFPQLIAGPIVRYDSFADEIDERHESVELFSYGMKRFVMGLGKKVLLANMLALISDKAFNMPAEQLSTSFAWMGALCYTLMIFFDFSGYSDMAIGLGKMFGFNFDENFDYPYISRSISEFWRRWHISLGSWFRDYVYFPLGGSRVKTKSRLILNLFAVWSLTGIWHGANWTFLVWGLMYFVLIAAEKLYGERIEKVPMLFRYLVTMFFVVIGWVIFRSDTIAKALRYMYTMLVPTFSEYADALTVVYMKEYIVYLVASVICAFPVLRYVKFKPQISRCISSVSMLVIFVLSVIFIVKGSYNVFIYFNF